MIDSYVTKNAALRDLHGLWRIWFELVATLAAAYAEVGRFSDAVATAEMALQLATDSGNRQMADVIRGDLEFYRAEQPFRDVR